jgi:hypothetical protein
MKALASVAPASSWNHVRQPERDPIGPSSARAERIRYRDGAQTEQAAA